MKRKWVWRLWWNGEVIDSFDTANEARKMCIEYNLAFHGGVIVKRGYEDID